MSERSPNRRRVLVVDDDDVLRDFVCGELEAAGYETAVAGDGREGVDIGLTWESAIILLDVIMPRLDGFEACRRIRERSSVPIIMLTARGIPSDRVRGFDAGADDYLAKPFSIEELLARMRAVLRRSEGKMAPWDGEVVCGDVVVLPGSGEVTLAGEMISLSPRELQLLLTLAKRPDSVIDYRTLLASAWGVEYREDMAALRVNISRLRVKIEPNPSDPRYLRTRRGVGYWLCSRPGGESSAESST